jgi:[citrate (pro-3S)-lyase] ligase
LEAAAKHCEILYVFVVEEDASVFPFAVRLRLVREGAADIPNCRVLPAGAYIISLQTFPSYFSGAERHAAVHASLDLHLFGQRIAPALGIHRRFVGTEPISAITRAYNEAMLSILPGYGVETRELERLEDENGAISASRVRSALARGDMASALRLVPPATRAFLQSEGGGAVITELRRSAGQGAD